MASRRIFTVLVGILALSLSAAQDAPAPAPAAAAPEPAPAPAANEGNSTGNSTAIPDANVTAAKEPPKKKLNEYDPEDIPSAAATKFMMEEKSRCEAHLECSKCLGDTCAWIDNGETGAACTGRQVAQYFKKRAFFSCPVNDWKEVPGFDENSPTKRKGHSMDLIGSKLYIFGGCYLDIVCYNDMYMFEMAKYLWVPLEGMIRAKLGVLPSPRGGHSSAVVDHTIWMFGGGLDNNYLRDVFTFDTVHSAWSKPLTLGTKPTAREYHTGTSYKDKIFIFGGYSNKGPMNDLHVLDTTTRKWSSPTISGHGPSPRFGHTAVLMPESSHMIIFGGTVSGGAGDDKVYILDTEFFGWTKLHVMGVNPIGRSGAALGVIGKSLFVTGGCDSKAKKCYNSTLALDMKRRIWGYPDEPIKKPKASAEGALLAISDDSTTVKADPAADGDKAAAAPAAPKFIPTEFVPRGDLRGAVYEGRFYTFGGCDDYEEHRCYFRLLALKVPKDYRLVGKIAEPEVIPASVIVAQPPAAAEAPAAGGAGNATAAPAAAAEAPADAPAAETPSFLQFRSKQVSLQPTVLLETATQVLPKRRAARHRIDSDRDSTNELLADDQHAEIKRGSRLANRQVSGESAAALAGRSLIFLPLDEAAPPRESFNTDSL